MVHTAETLQDAFRYLFPDEVRALKELAQSLPADPVVVNIGAGSGTSGLAFRESRPDLILYTIDIEDQNSPLGSLYSEAAVLREAGLDSLDYYRPIHGDSKEVARSWTAGLVDLVFVDGDHTYEGCWGDITGWWPHLRPGGIMAIHDYDKQTVYARPNLPAAIPHYLHFDGVDAAVRELLLGRVPLVCHVDTLIAFRKQNGLDQ